MLRFDSSTWTGYLWIFLAILMICLVVASCGSYQPPGEDLWKAL